MTPLHFLWTTSNILKRLLASLHIWKWKNGNKKRISFLLRNSAYYFLLYIVIIYSTQSSHGRSVSTGLNYQTLNKVAPYLFVEHAEMRLVCWFWGISCLYCSSHYYVSSLYYLWFYGEANFRSRRGDSHRDGEIDWFPTISGIMLIRSGAKNSDGSFGSSLGPN